MYDNLMVVGTTHLTAKEEIEDVIRNENPDIIGVELCQTRYNILIKGQVQATADNKTILGKIAKAIKEKAEKEALVYASDMITACKYAEEHSIKLILVDRNIAEIQALFVKIPAEEQQGFAEELQKFQAMTLKESTANINEEEVIAELKTNYPVSYEFLINSREYYIANIILKTLIQNPHKKLLVFLGKGHIKSISKLLE